MFFVCYYFNLKFQCQINYSSFIKFGINQYVGKTILKELEVNSLSTDTINDNKLCCCFIHVANPT